MCLGGPTICPKISKPFMLLWLVSVWVVAWTVQRFLSLEIVTPLYDFDFCGWSLSLSRERTSYNCIMTVDAFMCAGRSHVLPPHKSNSSFVLSNWRAWVVPKNSALLKMLYISWISCDLVQSNESASFTFVLILNQHHVFGLCHGLSRELTSHNFAMRLGGPTVCPKSSNPSILI